MLTLKDFIENAKAKAKTADRSVMIYDTGSAYEMILDGEGPGTGRLSYIVHPDGSVDLVDG